MTDALKPITGEQAKMIALQFLGQNLGEMKELDKNIVSSLKPIAGSINPHAMLNTITGSPQPDHVPVAPPPAPVQQAHEVHQPVAVQPVVQPQVVVEQSPVDPNQLEFSFDNSVTAVKIFDKIELLERKLASIQNDQQEIISLLTDIKKKSEAVVD